MTCSIFLKSYSADLPWLEYALRSVRKFASGFSEVIVALPEGVNIEPKNGERIVHIRGETSENGYCFQQAAKLYADILTNGDLITYLDSDTIFTQPVTPETFLRDGKILWMMTPWSDVADLPWKPIMEKFMGREAPFEFMRRAPAVFPRWLYQSIRDFCWLRHGRKLQQYIMDQPHRAFSEFNIAGFFAYEFHRDKFHWIDTSKDEWPELVVNQRWSYSGITPEIKAEIELILETPDGMRISKDGKAWIGNDFKEIESPIKQTEAGIWVLSSDSHISKWVEEKGQLQHDFQMLPLVLPEIPVGGLVVDVGAFIGDSTGPFLERVGEHGQVIAFEPNVDAFECLKRNCPEAVCSQQALGRANGSSGLHICPNVGASYIGDDGEQYIEIRTLDSFELSRCDLIKLDCEGFEVRVLQGAEETINKFRPKLLIEINEGALKRQGASSQELFGWLREHGYEWSPVQELHVADPPQYDILAKYTGKEGDAKCPAIADQKSRDVIGRGAILSTKLPPQESNAAPKSNPESAATTILTDEELEKFEADVMSARRKPITPWADKKESLAYLDWIAKEAKRFCTAPRYVTIVRERLQKAGVIKKLR